MTDLTPPLSGLVVPSLTPIVAALPSAIPFVAPEALERQSGRPLAVRLGANESLFGPSPKAVAAMASMLESVSLYGDPESYDLRTALAAHHGVTRDHLVLGCGIDELLGVLVRAYLAPGEPIVMSAGGYPTFAYLVNGHGGIIHTVPYRDDRNDLPGLLDLACKVKAKLLYLANPDNPSGTWLDRAAQHDLIAALPENCLLVLDEAYAEFAEPDTLADPSSDDPRVIRLRTFSKAHGLAGLRVGYALGAPATIRPFDRIRNQFGVGRLAQRAALAALDDQDHVAAVVGAVREGRCDYAALAAELGFAALPSATNFVAIDVGDVERARRIVGRLNTEEGVFIRMPGAAPLNRCIRVTVGRPEDRSRFAEAFRRVATTL